MSTERILVHSTVATKFQFLLNRAISKTFDSPTNTPTVITTASAKRNRALVKQAVSNGAKYLHGGRELNLVQDVETRLPPVVLTEMTKEMDLYASESFGPSVSLFTFDTEEEALDVANDTSYGLSTSIFTENLGLALRVADKLESGAVHINSMTVHDEFSLPHGGVKNSGFGRFNGYHGLDEFLYFKTVTWMNRVRSLCKTRIPRIACGVYFCHDRKLRKE
ncbi:Aldehyde/histidinol dehydrogenase [Diaporthe sp. PMI_573]|nr:Aldehyde/histidinol dehydrogenase [Diaporthaceae sp. PMI_573]